MATVPFQSFADSSHKGIVEQHVQCVEPPASGWICRFIWQQSVALFNELWKQNKQLQLLFPKTLPLKLHHIVTSLSC